MSLRLRVAALLAALLAALPACTFEVSSNDPAAAPERTSGNDGSASAGDDDEGGVRIELVQSDRPPPPSKVSAVVDRVLPSVVNVRVTSLGGGLGSEQASGQGSGVIIASDGVILTNAHVIQQALEVTVVLSSGRQLPGEVVGQAPERDLAVIRVDADNLRPITLGRSQGPNGADLGDPVVAIGFPLGLGGPTVTSGIVSGENRDIDVGSGGDGVRRLVGLLQTDAAINPGNSGGALVDMAGQLIGINSAAAQAGAAENVGFAIAIDDALPVVREILAEPPERRAWLGVQMIPLTDVVALQLGLPPGLGGAAVAGIIPGSPAAEAGVARGDVIVAIDGDSITSPNDLTQALTRLAPGDEIEIEVVNAQGARRMTIELAQRPATF
jgi:serine protease Do